MELQAVIKRNVDEVYVSLNIVIAGKGLSRSLDAHWPTNRLCHAVTATKKKSFRNANFCVIFCFKRAHTNKNEQKMLKSSTKSQPEDEK